MSQLHIDQLIQPISSLIPYMKRTSKRRSARQRSLEERLAERLRSRTVEDAKFRARQAQGKLRRFVTATFRKEEVIEKLALRRGECNRCGACCEILFKCPFLKKHSNGTTSCGIYEDRPNQCRLFPMEQRDLQEVRGTCSFYFIEKPVKLERAS
ncbi:MAG TPA: YkgJ family cysteine cluster protein [Pyrinomonadaceae bacterium]|nr:YkgJ family cysteine cluster protein [Pyrinomonadaceae bacterium]